MTLMSLFAIRIWIQGIDQFGKLLYRILGSGLRTVTTAALNLQLEQNPQMPASYQDSGQLSLNEGNSVLLVGGYL